MIKGVIFDFDGTLADTLPLCIAAFKKAISPLSGRTYTDKEITDTFGPSEEGTIRSLLPHSHEEATAAYIHHYRELHTDDYKLFPGIKNLLDNLIKKNIRVGMVTGKGARSLAISLDLMNLNSSFEHIRCGEPSGPSKVKGIRGILDEWNLQPGEAIYIGDAPSDVLFSREVGIRIISVAYAQTAEPEVLRGLNPDVFVETVAELENAIFKLIADSGTMIHK